MSLKHPTVLAKLGLLGQGTSSPGVEHSMEITESVIKYVDSDLKEQTLSLQTLAPEELLSVSSGYIDHLLLLCSAFFLNGWGVWCQLSVQVLSKGDKETSIQLLRCVFPKTFVMLL